MKPSRLWVPSTKSTSSTLALKKAKRWRKYCRMEHRPSSGLDKTYFEPIPRGPCHIARQIDLDGDLLAHSVSGSASSVLEGQKEN